MLQAGQTFVFRAVPAAEAARVIGAPLNPKPPPGALVAVQTPVTLGTLQNGRFALFRGLEPSDRIVVGNLAQLRSGMALPVR